LSDNLACSRDSGGPITTVYKGTSYYLSSGIGGRNVRACGAGFVDDPTKAFGYFSPVYKHLDLIKAAEDFIKTNSTTTLKISITCIKGKPGKKVSGNIPKCPSGYKKKQVRP
jgi:hypothetical protein